LNISICNAKELPGTLLSSLTIRQIFSHAEDLADFFWRFEKNGKRFGL